MHFGLFKLVVISSLLIATHCYSKTLPDSLLNVSPILQEGVLDSEWIEAIEDSLPNQPDAVIHLKNYVYFVKYLSNSSANGAPSNILAFYHASASLKCANRDLMFVNAKSLILHSADKYRRFLEASGQALKSEFSQVFYNIVCSNHPETHFERFADLLDDEITSMLAKMPKNSKR